jgi:hypothetical protein
MSPHPRRRRWLRILLALAGFLVIVSFGFSFCLRFNRVHRYLVARLETAFGRPVEVNHFAFSLLDGMRIEADAITIAEDPRYGYEYFLRAESMTAGLRWRSLFAGKFEFGTLSFSRPSLNLVRGVDGHWNLESWLPRSASFGLVGPLPIGPMPASPITPGRLYRIEVDGGRLNLKNGADKSAFALVEVKGLIEQENPGRWHVDLEALPIRSTVALQAAGTIRVRGSISGTSARLQPAELTLTWQEASLADALRLLRGRDFGVRGTLAAEVTARIAPLALPAEEKPGAPALPGVSAATWQIHGALRMEGVHRWDLPQRADNPNLNLLADAKLETGAGRVEFSRFTLEAPRSSVRGVGAIQWAPVIAPEFHLLASDVDFVDLLAWYRAFHDGVAGDVKVDGILGLDVILKGWPLRLDAGMVKSPGGRMESVALRERVRVGPFTAQVRKGVLELLPATLTFDQLPAASATVPAPEATASRAASTLQVTGSIGTWAEPGSSSRKTIMTPGKTWRFEIAANGQLERVQDVLAAGRLLGRAWNSGWTSEGRADVGLRVQGTIYPYAGETLGEINLNGVSWQAPYLNQPVLFEKAKIELKPGERRVTLASAQALGGQWKGRLSKLGDAPWAFDLAVDRVDVADLDRWLGPRARPPGFLESMLPFAGGPNRASEVYETMLNGLRATGKLQLGLCAIGSLRVENLRGEVEMEGRSLRFRGFEGAFYKGKVRGEVGARLTREPAYQFNLQWEGVDLGALTDATSTLKGRFGGTASGTLNLATHGVGRANLAAALEGRGSIAVRGAQFRGLDIEASYTGGNLRPGTSHFAEAQAEFKVGASRIEIREARLSNRGNEIEVQGRVNFSRALDLRLSVVKRTSGQNDLPGAPKLVWITGTVQTPRVVGPAEAPAPK